jgi:hypothetical protein
MLRISYFVIVRQMKAWSTSDTIEENKISKIKHENDNAKIKSIRRRP